MALRRKIISLLAVFCLAFLCCSCGEKDKAKVLVVHSYDESGQEGRYFQRKTRNCFKEQRINASTTHFYFDLVNEFDLNEERALKEQAFEECIKEMQPDVIIINDDAAFHYIQQRLGALIKDIPTVFAGVSVPEWDKEEFPLVCGIADSVDLATNVLMSYKLSGTLNPTVELDYGPVQDKLRKSLYENIADTTLFFNNADFSLKNLKDDYIKRHYPGRVAINFLSLRDRTKNKKEGAMTTFGYSNTHSILSYAFTLKEWQIQVKYDIYSNIIINTSRRPAITAIREQFSGYSRKNRAPFSINGGDPSGKKNRTVFLCGYFASTDTQIEDEVEYAAKIIRGAKPSELPLKAHRKGYYMDWFAMEKMVPPYRYEDYKDSFEIVNVPFNVAHKKGLVAICICSGLIFAAAVALNLILRNRRRTRQRKELLEQLSREQIKRDLAMRGTEAEFVMLKDGNLRFFFNFAKRRNMPTNTFSTEDFRKYVHPSTISAYDSFICDTTGDKKYKKTRLKLKMRAEEYKWWMVYYTVSEVVENALVGVFVNIDGRVRDEGMLQANVKRAEEVAAKEFFIANITHDIRTPLNAIAGFAQILADGCDPADAKEYSEIISNNTEQLLALIEEALDSSTNTLSEDFRMKLLPVDLEEAIRQSYVTNKVLRPSHLEFYLEPPQHTPGRIIVDADLFCLERVINNLVGNAFKYTPQGHVTLGWELLDGGKKVRIFVRDTGRGISEKEKKQIFDRFYVTEGNTSGTGLGLFICQKIITGLGGTYDLESTLGKGSDFNFTLPVKEIRTEEV